MALTTLAYIVSLTIYVYIVYTAYIDIPCVTRSGTSTVSCSNSETMVSCGFDQDGVQGTWIDTDDICTAYASGKTAKARCCEFPSDAIIDASTESSATNSLVDVTCASGSILTGCDPRHVSGTAKRFKGSWSGSLSYPPESAALDTWMNTGNKCNAESWSIEYVKAGARCLSLNARYTLECKTKVSFTDFSNFGECEAGYSMMACNAWTEKEENVDNLDMYYVDDNDACKVRQSQFNPLYANAICCRLFQGNSINPTVSPMDPTTKPTNIPTDIPSMHPSVDPTIYPTNVPSNDPTNAPTYYPIVNPTKDPSYVLTAAAPSSDPTNAPSYDSTKAQSNDPIKVLSDDPTARPTAGPMLDPSDDVITTTETLEASMTTYTKQDKSDYVPAQENSMFKFDDGFIEALLFIIGGLVVIIVLCACCVGLLCYFVGRSKQSQQQVVILQGPGAKVNINQKEIAKVPIVDIAGVNLNYAPRLTFSDEIQMTAEGDIGEFEHKVSVTAPKYVIGYGQYENSRSDNEDMYTDLDLQSSVNEKETATAAGGECYMKGSTQNRETENGETQYGGTQYECTQNGTQK